MKLIRKLGAASQIFQIFIADTSSTVGAGLPGLTQATSGLTAYYHRDTDTTATAITLVTMTVGTFLSSGFKEIDATNMPGWYQFCPPNAALAAGAASCAFHLKGAANMAPLPIEVDLGAQVDVTSWNGTAVSAPATAGIPEVNIKNINNVSASSVATVNANQGTTQPLNFTGTGASALAKSDTVDIAGAAVSATTAQIGVNVVNWNNTVVATPATAGIPDVNVKNISNLVATGNAAFGPVWDVVRASHTTVGTYGGDTVTPPTNFSSLGITAAGRIDVGNWLGNAVTLDSNNAPNVSTKYVGGTLQTARDLGAQLDATVSSRMATYTQPTGFLAATFPSGTVANTTNITAGTITTATNLTNAPTSGDLTAAMKTSVATAALATQMTESYAALGVVPTLAQATFEIRALLTEPSVSGTTVTTKKVDGSTTAHTYTTNSATTPTSMTTAS